jgi:hypothetical protein
MDHKFDFGPEPENRIVYVRSVSTEDLPEDLRDKIGHTGTVYGVYNAEGERLALVRDRRMAFVLARQHDLRPVTVH